MKHIKKLDICFSSGDEQERKKKNRSLLFCVLLFVLAFAGVLTFAHFTDSCRKHPQRCYCDSLAQESRPAERAKLLKEIKERGYSCVGIYYQE